MANKTQTENTAPKKGLENITEALPVGADGKVDFDSAQGECFVGLNLLALEVNEADGPFKVVDITPREFGVGKAKSVKEVYSTVKGSTPVQMPISSSFLTKAKEAKLKVGDTFIVKRGPNFTAKEYNKENCKSYLIKVTARA